MNTIYQNISVIMALGHYIARGMIAVIICRLYIKNIDYNSVLDKLMPVISRYLGDLDNVFSSLLRTVISKKEKPRALTKLVVSLIPNKNDLAVSLLQQYSYDILSFANKVLQNLMIIAEVKSIKARTIERAGGKIIRLDIEIDKIDYGQTAVNLMPLSLGKLSSEDSKAGRIVAITTKQYKLIERMLKSAFSDLKDDEKDELLVSVLKEFRKEILDTANQAIAKNEIVAEIADISFQARTGQSICG